MKPVRADMLLQLAFLEGVITTRGLYESVAGKRAPSVRASLASRRSLEARLKQALAHGGGGHVPLTVGMFLKKGRTEQALRPQEVSSRVGLSSNVYALLEHDRISPLKVPAESWRKLRELFRWTTEEMFDMIRRTHRLVLFRPSFRMTLARYDTRKKKGLKKSTLEQAAREMYIRGKLSIPEEEERKLDALFRAIRRPGDRG